MTRRNGFVFALLIVIFWQCTLATAKRKNPYLILGVKRGASEQEIKTAFKTLAKKWHPDKSSYPNAAKTFNEIQKAYKNLSDKNLKRYFDRHGVYRDEAAESSYSFYSYRTHDPDASSASTLITAFNYPWMVRDSVASSTRIWLIKVYSSRCSLCEVVAAAWEDAAIEFRGIVYTGRLNFDESGDLVRELGVRSLPAILAVGQGHTPGSVRVLHFQRIRRASDVSITALQSFISDVFPDMVTYLSSETAVDAFLAASNKLRMVFMSVRWRRPPLRLKRFVYSMSKAMPEVSFGFAPRSVAGYVTKALPDDTSPASDVMVVRELNSRRLLLLKDWEMLLQDDPEELEKQLHKHQHLYMPPLSHLNYYSACIESPRHICFVVLTDDPDLFWSAMSPQLEGLTALLDRYEVGLGWVRQGHEREFARFVGADLLLQRMPVAVVAVDPSANKYLSYAGSFQGNSVLRWMTDVADGKQKMEDGLKKGGLPFLAVPPKAVLMEGLLEWVGAGFRAGPLRRLAATVWSWLLPLLTSILYVLLIVGAVCMLMFAPSAHNAM